MSGMRPERVRTIWWSAQYVIWGPPTNNRGTLNGVDFTNFNQLINKVVSTIEQKGTIDLRLYGDWSTAATPLVLLIKKSPLERTRSC